MTTPSAAANAYASLARITDASAQVTVEVPVRNDRAAAASVELGVDLIDAEGQVALSLKQSQPVAAGTAASTRGVGRE